MRAIIVILLLCLIAPAVRGQACEGVTVMRQGAAAACDGVLVSPSRGAQCVADADLLDACGLRLAGEVDKRAAAEAGWRLTIAALEAALAVERERARTAPAVVVETDWGAIGWGVFVGVLVGAGVSVAVAVAR